MRRTSKWALTGFTLVLIYALAFLMFWFFNFQKVVVSGVSMEPTLKNGRNLWSCKAYWLVGPIKRGDIVVIREEAAHDTIIKRVYRMGGEVVDYAWIPNNYAVTQGPYVVPEGQIYVLGDNRPESEDSRIFGPVPLEEVRGKIVFFSFWSFVLAVAPIVVIVIGGIFARPGASSAGDGAKAA